MGRVTELQNQIDELNEKLGVMAEHVNDAINHMAAEAVAKALAERKPQKPQDSKTPDQSKNTPSKTEDSRKSDTNKEVKKDGN